MIFRHQGRNRYLSIFPPHHLRTELDKFFSSKQPSKKQNTMSQPFQEGGEGALLSDLCIIWYVCGLRSTIRLISIQSIQANQRKTTATPTRLNTAVRAAQPAPAHSPARAATNSGPNAPACATRLRTCGATSSRRRRRSIAISISSQGLRGAWNGRIGLRRIGGCLLTVML